MSMAVGSLVVTGVIGRYRINLTPSEPLGLWRIEELHRPVAIGDLVFVCPPKTAQFDEALRRGYLRRGLCAEGFAPLIKTVVALPGQRVEISDQVFVDGRPVPFSLVVFRDGEGRAIVTDPGGVVPAGTLFLHSPYAGSYDSRYFGPVPDAGLLGLARPVFTFYIMS
jgi:conjugative transfer signal peptidase TraF